jgi:diguanylate cyclase (GGDEF)-like protein
LQKITVKKLVDDIQKFIVLEFVFIFIGTFFIIILIEMHKHQREKFQEANSVRYMDKLNSELLGLEKNGSIFSAEITISTYSSGDKRACISITRDKTSRNELEKKLLTDPLTSLSNRKHINKVLREEIERARRHKHKFSVVMMDIDNFKLVNDTYGHQKGDQALVLFSEYLLARIRKIDTAGRWGGEEFCILCPETDLNGTIELVENIRKGLGQAIKKKSGNNFTISSGVAEYDIDSDDEYSLLKRADDALYKAKNSGRNRTES